MSNLSDTQRQQIQELADLYPHARSAVMPALHLVQANAAGSYLSRETLREVADCLQVPPMMVLEIATFYSLFNSKPIGRYHLQLCTNIACMLRGAERLKAHLEQQLEIKSGETSADGLFTLSSVECLGACEQAPMLQLNEEYRGYLDEQQLDRLISNAREEQAKSR